MFLTTGEIVLSLKELFDIRFAELWDMILKGDKIKLESQKIKLRLSQEPKKDILSR